MTGSALERSDSNGTTISTAAAIGADLVLCPAPLYVIPESDIYLISLYSRASSRRNHDPIGPVLQ